MRSRYFFLAVVLVLGLALLGWPETEVPVPDQLGTSRDWQAPDNAAMFRPVEAPDNALAVDYSTVIYDKLGQSEASP